MNTIALTITGTPEQLEPITRRLTSDGQTVRVVNLAEMLLECEIVDTEPRVRFTVDEKFAEHQAELAPYMEQILRDVAELARQTRTDATVRWVAPPWKPSCRFCGCTDLRACAGGCSWSYPGVCSACVDAIAAHHPAADAILAHLRDGDIDTAVVVHHNHDSGFRFVDGADLFGPTGDGGFELIGHTLPGDNPNPQPPVEGETDSHGVPWAYQDYEVPADDQADVPADEPETATDDGDPPQSTPDSDHSDDQADVQGDVELEPDPPLSETTTPDPVTDEPVADLPEDVTNPLAPTSARVLALLDHQADRTWTAAQVHEVIPGAGDTKRMAKTLENLKGRGAIVRVGRGEFASTSHTPGSAPVTDTTTKRRTTLVGDAGPAQSDDSKADTAAPAFGTGAKLVAFLKAEGGRWTARELHTRLGVTKSSITLAASKLVADGLVLSHQVAGEAVYEAAPR